MNDSTELYGVKILLKYTVENVNKITFFEEQVLTAKANSFDEAYEKVEKYAEEYSEEYLNPNGEKVRKEFYKSIDCFYIYPENDDVQEVYSRFISNETELSDDKYIDVLYKQCDSDDLYVLRYN